MSATTKPARRPLAQGLLLVATTFAAVVLAASCGGGVEDVLLGDVAVASGQSQTPQQPSPTTDVAPTPTSLPAASATPVPTPEPTAIPLVANVVGSGGASATYKRVDLDVIQATATNLEPSSLVAGEPELDSQSRNWLVVDIDAESQVDMSLRLPATNMVLVDPDGRPTPGSRWFNVQGQSGDNLGIDGRQYSDMQLFFETPELISDTTDWYVSIEVNDQVPLWLPLNGSTVVDPYPMPLAPAEPVTLLPDDPQACRDGAQLDFEVVEANLALEVSARTSTGRLRANADYRAVSVLVEVTNDLATGNQSYDDLCGRIQYHWPDFVLEADGRPYQRADDTGDWPQAEVGETVQYELRYFVPSATTKLELIGGLNNTALASWQVSLPLAPGDEGYEPTVESVNEPLTAADGVSAIDLSAAAAPTPGASAAEPAGSSDAGTVDYDRLRLIRVDHIEEVVDGDTSACFAFTAPLDVVVWLGGTLELRDDMIDQMLAAFEECGIDPLEVLAEAEGN